MSKRRNKSQAVSVHSQYAGPIPPANELVRYNDAHPEAAKIILDMAQKQQDHSLEIGARMLTHETRQVYIGQIFGFLVSLSLIGAAVYAIHCDSEVAAGILAALGVGSAAGVFLVKRGK